MSLEALFSTLFSVETLSFGRDVRGKPQFTFRFSSSNTASNFGSFALRNPNKCEQLRSPNPLSKNCYGCSTTRATLRVITNKGELFSVSCHAKWSIRRQDVQGPWIEDKVSLNFVRYRRQLLPSDRWNNSERSFHLMNSLLM